MPPSQWSGSLPACIVTGGPALAWSCLAPERHNLRRSLCTSSTRRKKPYNASIMRYSITVAMLALIVGCAQLEWLRPDTEPATLDEDLARCEQQARLTASRMSPSAYGSMPSVSVGPGGIASVQMPPPYAPSDLVLENDLLTSCMHAKGYRLFPAKSAGGH